MSEITYKSFSKLHEKHLEDIQYKKGYERAKGQLLQAIQSLNLSELFYFMRSLRTMGYKDRNYYAIGQAHAVLEIIRSRVGGSVAAN